MFEKIFIIEDTQSDINDIVGFLRLVINQEQIIIIKDIKKALDVLTQECKPGKSYAAFVDILWQGENKGIHFAKTVRKTLPLVKLIAFTGAGVEKNIDEIRGTFHAFIDKNTSSPNKFSKIVSEIDYNFLEQVEKTDKFIPDLVILEEELMEINNKLGSYFFKIVEEKKVVAQFLVADFYRFSLKDDDLQLSRFRRLQNALGVVIKLPEFSELQMIFLPTGDGVVIGILNQLTEPYALMMAFKLLGQLRSHGLDKELRIGIHHGPVYHIVGEKGEAQLIGPGINMTTRVESAGKPGMVLISDDYFRLLIDRSGSSFCQELTIHEPSVHQIKEEPEFTARFISKGNLGLVRNDEE